MQVGSFPAQAEKMVAGLGGAHNIERIEVEVTRIKAVVRDPAAVDEKAILAAPAWDVKVKGNEVDIVTGTMARKIGDDIQSLLG